MAGCVAWCNVAGTTVACDLQSPHEHEHEANTEIEVYDDDTGDVVATVPFLVWWGDDGHAFVGGNKAVNTGSIR